ncbi:MAG TPA: type II secretion system protein GspM [Candidatus Acidoferrum sp.]|nr:type II secretion system protein GspM [Candidatus Acidoferrum sp.]
MNHLSRGRQITLFGTLAVMLAGVLIRYGGGDRNQVVASRDSIPVARQRLEILRRKAATVPAKEAILKHVSAELQEREKGVVQAGTAEQARAHLMDVLHASEVANGFDSQGAQQLPEPKALGQDYGQVSVGQNFTCRIDQLVNFLSALANEPEILATDTIIVSPVRNPNKEITVRLTLSGVIPKSLVPEKKKGVNF